MSTSKLGDDLLRVPKLDVAGANWVIYKDRLSWSVDARGLLGHIDGTETMPADPISESLRQAGALTAEQTTKDAEWKKELKAWKLGEAIVKQQIASTIPDSLFMKIRNQGTAHEIWKALAGDFQNKSRMVSVDL
ncbi:hypothetical protein BJ912DRAFT_809060, partial [Pholiota molesta]